MDINEEIINNIENFEDLRRLINQSKEIPKQDQSGGFAFVPNALGMAMNFIKDALVSLGTSLYVMFYRLFSSPGWIFSDDPDGDWNNPNRGQFYKYLWFCFKVGLALIIFAIAGPIFIVIGIGYIYSNLLKKMNVDGATLVRDRLADAQST